MVIVLLVTDAPAEQRVVDRRGVQPLIGLREQHRSHAGHLRPGRWPVDPDGFGPYPSGPTVQKSRSSVDSVPRSAS